MSLFTGVVIVILVRRFAVAAVRVPVTSVRMPAATVRMTMGT